MDVFKEVKERENAAALKLLPQVGPLLLPAATTALIW
jgi:hypothetical protein